MPEAVGSVAAAKTHATNASAWSLPFIVCLLALLWPSVAQAQPLDRLDSELASEEAEAASWGDDPFAKGNTFWSLRGGFSRDAHLGDIYHTQLAAGKFVDDQLAVYLGLSLGYADISKNDDGVLGGPHVGVRWHFVEKQKLSLYLDASLGIVLHQHPITPESLHFNFDLEAGVGATWQLSDSLLLDAGVRWHHLSNARVKGTDRNLGYDGPMGYLGVVIPF